MRKTTTTGTRELAAELQAGCSGARIGRLQRLVSRHYTEALRAHAMTLSQMELLATLVLHGGPVKPTALADALAVERSTMSRNLALLVEAGWVEAADTSASRRAMSVTITTAGADALVAAGRSWREAQTAVARALGRDANATLDRWIAQLT